MTVPLAFSDRLSRDGPCPQLSAFALLTHSVLAGLLAALLLASKGGSPNPLVAVVGAVCLCIAAPVALVTGAIEATWRAGRSPTIVSTALLMTLAWHFLFPRLGFLADAALRPVALSYCAYSLCLGALTLSRTVRARWNS